MPQRVLFECFLAFFGPKNAKKHSKSTLWGTPRQVPKIAQKALRGALSGPGPKSTPVNGGRDRKVCALFFGPDFSFSLKIQGHSSQSPVNFEVALLEAGRFQQSAVTTDHRHFDQSNSCRKSFRAATLQKRGSEIFLRFFSAKGVVKSGVKFW